MKQYVGLDVSQDQTSICVVDESGRRDVPRMRITVTTYGKLARYVTTIPLGSKLLLQGAMVAYAYRDTHGTTRHKVEVRARQIAPLTGLQQEEVTECA